MKNKNNEVVSRIKNQILDICGKHLVSIYSYGSALTNHFSKSSDFDFLIILDEANIDLIKLLRNMIIDNRKNGIRIDVNIQTADEMPSIRGDAFWHNNRGIFIQPEINNYGKLLYGKNQFLKGFDNLKPEEMRLESVRVLNSLVYQARKCLLNRNLAAEERYIFMKHCIYASMYALAAKGIFLKNYSDILDEFHKQFPELPNPNKFANKKIGEISDITEEDVQKSYAFLKNVDVVVFEIYKKGLTS